MQSLRALPYLLTLWLALITIEGRPAQDSLSLGRSLPYDRLTPRDLTPGIGLFMDAGGSFLNTEYFHPLALGYTIPGAQVGTGYLWSFHRLVSLKFGWHLRLRGGHLKHIQHFPILSLSLTPLEGLTITLGSLSHPFSHALPNHLYMKGREWIAPPEFGASIAFRKALYQAELWVDWENFIWINSPTQERFFFGFTTAYAPLGPERLTVGLQAFAHHTGGQIDTANLPVQTLSNVAMSLSWVSEPWAQGRGRAGFDLWGLFSTNAKTLDLPTFTKQGWGGVASAFACFVGCRLSLEYYYGQGFMPLRGHPFYGARSQWSPQGQWERNRSMLTASLGYSKQWYHSISLEALADAHYDLPHRQLDYSFELSIRVALNYAVWTPHSPQAMEP